LVIVGIVAVWTLVTVANRVIVEQLNNTVELCLDLDATVDLCQKNGYRLAEFLQRCRLVGVTSVAVGEETLSSLAATGSIRSAGMPPPGNSGIMVFDDALKEQITRQLKDRYGTDTVLSAEGKIPVLTPQFDSPFVPSFWEPNLPLGFSPAKLSFLKDLGYRIVLKVQNAGDPGWLAGGLPGEAPGILFDGREVPGYPGKENVFIDTVRDNGNRVIAVEFSVVPGMDALKKALPQALVLGHTVTAKEMGQNMTIDALLARWQRAVRERGTRFIFFRFRDNRTMEDNMTYLRTLAQGLKGEGYVLDQAQDPAYPVRGGYTSWLLMALFAAAAVPLLAVLLGKNRKSPLLAYGTANLVTLSGGLFIAALLADITFMQKIIETPGVKAVMLAPLLAVPFILYSHNDWRRAWSSPLRVQHVAAAACVLAILALLYIRSGNNAATWLQPEHGMRQFFENLLAIRPRTKEFLFGQPLLFLGFYYRRKWLLWLGIIGQISVMNTFLHAHTPVMISLVRSLHGIWLGLLVGYAAALIVNLVNLHRPLK
jgi:hypothetical protein